MVYFDYCFCCMCYDEFLCWLMCENMLIIDDLIYLVFVYELDGCVLVVLMLGVECLFIDELFKVVEEVLELGILVIDLFLVIDLVGKLLDVVVVWDDNGLV